MTRITIGLLLALAAGVCLCAPAAHAGDLSGQEMADVARKLNNQAPKLAFEVEGTEKDLPVVKVEVVNGELVATGINAGADYTYTVTAEKDQDTGDISSKVEMDLPPFFVTSNLWVMIAAFLVFIMHLGFACVESGFTRAKNTVNILFKNTLIPCIGLIMFAICGWQIMYHTHASAIIDNVLWFGLGVGGGAKGSADWASNLINNTPLYNPHYTVWTDFLFQGMFAATCATIVSGAVVERVKLLPFMIFTVLFVAVLYPITGSWKWGGGWLDQLGFADFAGSTLVHAVGGAGALAGAILLGPRMGKYGSDGAVQPIPGHNMPLGAIGVFLLWFGWFGFNGGSELSANPEGVSWVCVTTSMAAAGGAVGAAGISWLFGGKPDLSMALNGILAGLVAITAGPDVPSWLGATVICGMIPGVIVYFSVLFFDKLRIDDPVGAISVHGVCGIYGTLAVAFSGAFEGNFGNLGVQALGTFSCFAASFVFAFIVFGVLKATMGVRVSKEEEIEGLDLGEHDMSAYPDFQRTYIKSYHAREM